MDVDLLVDEQRDVFDEKAEHALAFDGTGALVVPDARKIGGQRPDALLRGLVQQRAVGLVLALVLALERVDVAQPRVPVGFQRVGDQAVVRIDLQVASAASSAS
ncbi:hypothetical protein [Mesorhizobium sp. L48C026A00]|uniref:hypothetical protein n=1 Tax=Mesorhizobium sp. L48C026A00 TaxID=1287182 RepID=UPI0003D00690|nr:hypothetical protein [Mesorhizobium sp. L48C026A00]ESZ12168.1 hypothetical protein X737_27580 [Mesorhizobium sp. L48C026A00]